MNGSDRLAKFYHFVGVPEIERQCVKLRLVRLRSSKPVAHVFVGTKHQGTQHRIVDQDL